MSELVVRAQQITKYYGDFCAVDHVDLDVRAGECFGFLGPNGAGKTTFVRMIYGFTPITSGSLLVLGLDVRHQLRELKARIGICQQENNLDPDFSVLKNLLVYARYFGIPATQARSRAQELLEFSALAGRSSSRVEELSGGMQRRLVVARALINEPDLLILDEPTTGLDPQSRHQVWDRLEELKDRGMSILLTTHYMDEAASLCDRLVIMDHARVLVEGEPQQLIREHIGGDVVEVPSPPEALLEQVRQRGLRSVELARKTLIYVPHGHQLFREIAELCPEGCVLRKASLEDVFLELTGRELRE